MLKDMRLASRMNGCADFLGLEAARESLRKADAAGSGDEDYSSILKFVGQG
jgi:hypothetical protein